LMTGSQVAGGFRHPEYPPAHVQCVGIWYSAMLRTGPYRPISKLTIPSHFISLCDATSGREARDVAELARAHAGVVAEEAREMRWLGETKPCADIADIRGLMQYRVNRLLHPHHVQVDLGRHADRGFKQSEEMRARQSRFPGKGINAGPPAGGSHRGCNPANAPVARPGIQLPDRRRKTSPRGEAFDHRDHQIGQRRFMRGTGL